MPATLISRCRSLPTLRAGIFLGSSVSAFAQPLGHDARVASSVHGDLVYTASAGVPQKLDLILPKGADSPHPVVIILHGTGVSEGQFGVRQHALACLSFRFLGDGAFLR
jgi:hypothetical protein